MPKRGLIVSIQEYSKETTQELAERAVQAGAVALRTDQPINVNVPVIGLKKDYHREYYITPDVEAINDVAQWAAFVAIDCRAGNKQRGELLKHCLDNGIAVLHDIETFLDFESLPYPPHFTATTFSAMISGRPDFELIKALRGKTLIIAEGGIATKKDMQHAFVCGATWVCVGAEFMDIRRRVSDWVHCISGQME